MYYVYIIEAVETKKYYIGQTENIDGRVKKHNQGRNLSTKAYIPWQLKWWKAYETRSDAIKIEKKLKRIKNRIRLEKFIKQNEFSGCGAVGPVPIHRDEDPRKIRIRNGGLDFAGLALL